MEQQDKPHVPASWYPDPSRQHAERWWDGQQWTQQVRDTPPSGPSAPDGPTQPGIPPAAAGERDEAVGVHEHQQPVVSPGGGEMLASVAAHTSAAGRGSWLTGVPAGVKYGVVALVSALVGVAGGALFLGGDGGLGAKLSLGGSTHEIVGDVVVTDFDGCGLGEAASAVQKLDRLNQLKDGKTFPCPQGPGGGYDDLAAGANVVVRDGEGGIIATSKLTGGVQSSAGVTFTFTAKVPKTEFYEVEVSHRGGLRFSFEDLEKADWEIHSSIG